ncbi:hypothetical protein FRB99_004861, partial [Tulasnella sp. 403]
IFPSVRGPGYGGFFEQTRISSVSQVNHPTVNEMKPASEAVVTTAIDLILENLAVQSREDSLMHPRSITDTDTEFAVLDFQIKSLFEALRSVEAQIRSRISQLSRQRNTLSSIHRLPVETLVEIFKDAANQEYPPSDYYKALGRLSAVCTRWATIIDQAPHLWSIIFDYYDPRLVDKIIKRSRDHPLSLMSWRWLDKKDTSRMCRTPAAFLERLLPTVCRWEVAQLTISGQDIRYLEAYLGNPSAPKLKKLCIYIIMGHGPPINLFRGGAEHIEELELWGVPTVCWTSPLLSRLRILRLNDSTTDVTTSRLLTALMQFPDLSELRINKCNFHASTADDLPPRFELPRLQVLVLVHVAPPTTTYSILSRISPSSKYKHFRLISGSLPSGDVISHHIPSFRHLATSAGNAFIQFDPQYCQLAISSTMLSPSFELGIQSSRPMTVLAWITEAFAGILEGVDTEVRIEHVLSRDDIATVCRRVPTITALHILFGNPTPFVRHLSTPILIDGKQCWPLPKLARVSLTLLEDECDPGEIVDMVERRYGHAIKSTEDARSMAQLQLPSPFSSLVINGPANALDELTLQKIRSIVGEDHLERNVFQAGWD